MWRREERLEYWLAGGRSRHRPYIALWLEEKLSLKLCHLQFQNSIREQPLSIAANAIDLDAELSASVHIQDGLGVLSQWVDFQIPAGDAASELTTSNGATHCVDLLRAVAVRNLKLPTEQLARIQQGKMEIYPNSGSWQVNWRPAAVHALAHLQNQSAEVKDGQRILALNLTVCIMTSRFSEFPHVRKSLNVDRLSDSERQGFLREAEILRGIPADRVELLAVFRHVPIDVISRLSFLAEKRVILYSICGEPKRTHARVHDLAAVRNTANQEIYLIPHRTQFRSVVLN